MKQIKKLLLLSIVLVLSFTFSACKKASEGDFDKESVYIEYEEHEVYNIYSEPNFFKKYNYSVIIKVDQDEYIVFKTNNFIVKGDTVIIKLEEYPNGDTYASIVGVNCKKILIEEGTVIDSVAGN